MRIHVHCVYIDGSTGSGQVSTDFLIWVSFSFDLFECVESSATFDKLPVKMDNRSMNSYLNITHV